LTGQDLSGLSAVLKEWYIGPVNEQLNTDVMVTSLLNVTSEDLQGNEAVLPLHYGRSGGIGSRGENVALPTAGQQKFTKATYQLKYHYARVQVSGPAISNTRSDRGAFLSEMKDELDRIKNDLALDQARQFYGDGTAVIATVASVSGSGPTVVTLTSAEPISKGFLHVGMVIDMGAPATPHDIYQAQTITDVNVATPSITVAADGSGSSAADVIIRSGNATDTTTASAVVEMDSGLQKLIGTATLGGVNPSTAGLGFWQSDVVSKSGTPDISLDDLMVEQNKLNNAGAKNSDLTVMTTPGIVRRLFASTDFQDSVRFVNSNTLEGGFEQLSFAAGSGPMKINADRLHPWGQVSFVDKSTVSVYSPADWDFLQRDGLTVRWVQDYDAFQAVLFKYVNMGTKRRNTSARLTGYTDTGF